MLMNLAREEGLQAKFRMERRYYHRGTQLQHRFQPSLPLSQSRLLMENLAEPALRSDRQ
jgi:hypothetical protein